MSHFLFARQHTTRNTCGVMKTHTIQSLKRGAARFGISVETTSGKYNRAIYLDAPDGFRFEPELHCLVTEQGDNDTWASVIESALQDIAWHGPRINKCPDDCPCKETA